MRLAFGPAAIEKVVFIFISGSALVSFLLVVEQTFLLQFVPINFNNLIPVGSVDEKNGTPYRKLSNDSLYLPVSKGASIYRDDILTTDQGSQIKVRLAFKNSVEDFFILEPNSVIRVSLNNGEYLIDLKKGSLNTHFQSDHTVHVKTGTLTTALKIKRGSYLIKNSFFGIQITAYTQEVQVKGPADENTNKTTTVRALEDNPKPPSKSTSSSVELGYSQDFNIPMKLPFPEDKQVFLVTKGTTKKIVILAKKQCDTICRLIVKCNKTEIADLQFESGSSPSISINANIKPQCQTYNWFFKDDKISIERSFSVEDFSDESLNRYLLKGLSIEII